MHVDPKTRDTNSDWNVVPFSTLLRKPVTEATLVHGQVHSSWGLIAGVVCITPQKQLQMEYETSAFLRTFGHSPLGRSYGLHHLIEQPCSLFILLSSLSLPTFSTITFSSLPFFPLRNSKMSLLYCESNSSLFSSYSQTPGPSLQI